MKTQVFETYEKFLARPDKSVNGVSPLHAMMFANYEQDNELNTGCWNCTESEHCKYCVRSDKCSDSEYLINCIECKLCFDCGNCVNSSMLKNCFGYVNATGFHDVATSGLKELIH